MIRTFVTKKFFMALAVLCALAASGAETSNTNTDMQVFEGTVRRAKTVKLAFERKGKITYLHAPNIPLRADVFDKNSNLIRPGDIVAKHDTTMAENNLEIAKAKVKSAGATLKDAKNEYERSFQLKQKNAVSDKNFETARKNLDNAEAEFQNANAALENAKYDLESCSLRAPFCGIIEEYYYSVGTWVDNGKDVVQMSLLSPICIRVPLPQDVSRKIGITDSIKVFPGDGSQPASPWFDDFSIKTDYIDLYVSNKLVPAKKLTPEQEKLPYVTEVSFASKLHDYDRGELPPEIWVPENAIQKEGEAYYVWRAKGHKICDLKKPIALQFEAERIKVEPENIYRHLGIYNLQALKNAGDLHVFDVILLDAPPGLKNGETVLLKQMRWQFRPDEKVKVQVKMNN